MRVTKYDLYYNMGCEFSTEYREMKHGVYGLLKHSDMLLYRSMIHCQVWIHQLTVTLACHQVKQKRT